MYTILSIPLGPKEVRTASLMAKEKKKTYKQGNRDSFEQPMPLAATIFDNRSSIGLPLIKRV
jgi:hypothetical protein